ncbi:MAG: amino acid ABC transporter permease [Egibacteraceae bacterium]
MTAAGGGVRPPPWRDVRVLRVAFQVVFVAAVVALLVYPLANLRHNLGLLGLPTGFGFLGEPTGVAIRDVAFDPGQPIRDALFVGLLQTIQISAVGIVLATVLGVGVGMARLSANWLVRRAAAVYVETLRNIPVLVIIIFAYTAVALRLPPITQAAEWLDAVLLSNSGLWVPWVISWGEAGDVGGFFTLALAAGAAAVLAARWRTCRFDATGAPHHRLLWGIGMLAAVAIVGYFALGRPVALSLPSRDGLVVNGGIKLGPEFAALLAGLVIYTASQIAEVVRGSILAVPKGQAEAATAVGLTPFQRMRFVALPQALRIMIPPLANQYVSLTKNSSLAVAIGYFELAQITRQAVGNAKPEPQLYLLLMLCYLFLSLVISLVANLVNRRLAWETR